MVYNMICILSLRMAGCHVVMAWVGNIMVLDVLQVALGMSCGVKVRLISY